MPPQEIDEAQQNEIFHSLAVSFEVAQVPLVIATLPHQRVIASLAGMLNGTVLTSDEAFPCSAFLETLDRLDHVFVVLRRDFGADLWMMLRDYVLDRDAPLTTRFGEYTIHPEHRLVILVAQEDLYASPEDWIEVLLKLCVVKFVSGDGAPAPPRDRVFDSVDHLVAWCDRHYSSDMFYFRGQSQDWPLRAPLQRLDDQAEAAFAAQRTQRFVTWLRQRPESQNFRDDVSLAAVAQHFGFATNLLDLTRNPRVAAYFATVGSVRGQDEPGLVYIFSRHELEQYTSFDGDLATRMGAGPVVTEVPQLRRMRHQQGLFAEIRPWLIHEMVLTRLRFRHTDPSENADEDALLPREFLFPPPYDLERAIYAYQLLEAANGVLATPTRTPSPAPSLVTPTFELGGMVSRSYLDETDYRDISSVPSLFASLDIVSSLLSITTSYLWAQRASYLWHGAQLSVHLRQSDEDTAAEDLRALLRLGSEMNRPRPTGIEAPESLSPRDVVDSLSLYYGYRSGNRTQSTDAVADHLQPGAQRVWNAFTAASHFLGPDTDAMFPALASFALCCPDPPVALMDAVREAGRHASSMRPDRSYADVLALLSRWTGHEAIRVRELDGLLPLAPPVEELMERLESVSSEHGDLDELLGARIHLIDDSELIGRLGPAFDRRPGGKVATRAAGDARQRAALDIDAALSISDGLLGHATVMLCERTECPFHQHRVCGRSSLKPDDADTCRLRSALVEEWHVTIDVLEHLRAQVAEHPA